MLDDALEGGRDVGLVALVGPAGVGKTTLAVQWAHRADDRFPDGQLYLNLRGFDPAGQAMTADEALRTLLELLQVPQGQIPTAVQAQAGLYRSRLAGARMLIVLDNARDADQVRPLLPGEPGSMVLVTSRDQLTGLVAVAGAQPVRLDALGDAEARQLLAHRLGKPRLQAEPGAVEQIIAACGGLPLALAIVAARAAISPGFPLTAFAAELTDARGRLDALAGADPATDIRAVFSWSYQALRPAAARLFRLLGLHPGPDIGVDAAAALAEITPVQARRLLAELAGAHMLAEHSPGRYAFHDLVLAYATELTESADDDATRESALARMLDHYARTADAANRLLYPSRSPMRLPLPDAATTTISVTHLTDYEQAMDWFATEHQVLLAVLRHALSAGFPTQTWQLAWSIDTFLDRGGYWQHEADAWHCALESARLLDNMTAQADAHRARASALAKLRRYDEALEHLACGLDLSTQTGNQADQANIHRIFGFVYWSQGDPRQALHHALEALNRFRSAGRQDRVAGMLNNVGACYAQLGEHDLAVDSCQQAIPLLQERQDRDQEAHTWDSLGYSHHHLGHHDHAISCYRQAIALFREIGDRYNEALSLGRRGDVHHDAGDPETARTCWQLALDILTELEHPDAGGLRQKLESVPAR